MPDLVTSVPTTEPTTPTAPVSASTPEPSPPTNAVSPPVSIPPPMPASPPTPVSPTTGAAGFTVEAILEITQLCTLAGCPERILGFLEARTSSAQVRAQLLTAQAERSPEIISRLNPEAPVASASLSHNPVVLAVKKLIHKE